MFPCSLHPGGKASGVLSASALSSSPPGSGLRGSGVSGRAHIRDPLLDTPRDTPQMCCIFLKKLPVFLNFAPLLFSHEQPNSGHWLVLALTLPSCVMSLLGCVHLAHPCLPPCCFTLLFGPRRCSLSDLELGPGSRAYMTAWNPPLCCWNCVHSPFLPVCSPASSHRRRSLLACPHPSAIDPTVGTSWPEAGPPHTALVATLPTSPASPTTSVPCDLA